MSNSQSNSSQYGTISLYYDGQNQCSTEPKTIPCFNPASGHVVAHIEKSSKESVDAAIASASAAFPSWSKTPPLQRARILQNAVTILRERNNELALVETHDTGKAYSETSTVDIVTGTDVLEYYANLVGGGGLNGEAIQLREDAWAYTRKEPLGVCAGIGAWNYPIQIALWKSAPCLAAGNTMVYKPSEYTPLHSTILARLYTEAGLPPGVFNVVQGDGSVGQLLTTHPGIAKVSFTGQVSTGQKVASAASAGMKYTTMELGGKSPLIILPDADLAEAVDGAFLANFFSSGQVCTNGTRVFVPKSKKSDFEREALKKIDCIIAGDPADLATNFGPLCNEQHLEKVRAYIKHGIEIDMARKLCGGQSFEKTPPWLKGELAGGYWAPPTIFTDCTDEMRIVKEEIFGPVMTILPYDDSDIDGVIVRANATPMGLAAGVFTRDINLAHTIVARLEAGITWINTWGESPAEMSVGGWKLSGLGVENGRAGIEAWTQNKSTLVNMGKLETPFAKL